jgi:hypothetical protein
MKGGTFAASVIALALVAAALLNGGIYQMLRGDESSIYRLNRFTGVVSVCVVGGGGCHAFPEGTTLRAEPNATPTAQDFMKGMVPETPTK